jgi:fructose-bisphosphate aldolase class I
MPVSDAVFAEQLERAKAFDGYLAALDQSGGSTPKALKAFGIEEDQYVLGETSMFDVIHKIRARIITSPSFQGDRTLGAILFENTMDREIEGIPTPTYLWEKKQVIPFLKCDKGLGPLENGVQLMKPMPALGELLKRGKEKEIFGTKMRSVIKEYNEEGIQAIVDQQFEIGNQILDAGLIPILEPEVDITSPDKAKIEAFLKEKLVEGFSTKITGGRAVMIKLSLPTEVNLYKDLIDHPNCVRVVALSGGYARDEANEILMKQDGMIASFSRALAEGLNDKMTDAEWDACLDKSIAAIFEASKKK